MLVKPQENDLLFERPMSLQNYLGADAFTQLRRVAVGFLTDLDLNTCAALYDLFGDRHATLETLLVIQMSHLQMIKPKSLSAGDTIIDFKTDFPLN